MQEAQCPSELHSKRQEAAMPGELNPIASKQRGEVAPWHKLHHEAHSRGPAVAVRPNDVGVIHGAQSQDLADEPVSS